VLISGQVQVPPESVSGASTRELAVTAMAFDQDWKAVSTERVSVTLPAKTQAWWDVPMTLNVRPGRYEIRLAADDGRATGGAFLDIDVPDFAKESFTASGLVVSTGRTSERSDPRVTSVVPMPPTSTRDFAANERVTVLMRLYQGSGDKPLAATAVEVKILDDRDASVWSENVEVPAADFVHGRSADLRVDLPTSRLAAGEYLVRVRAVTGVRQLERRLIFRIASPR
jgi:hypothetical protein